MDIRQKLLDKLYNNPKSPVAFTGARTLYKHAKSIDPYITLKDVDDYLQSHRTYTLYKPRRIHFKRKRTIPSGYMTDVQVDLADFQKLSRHNKGNKYLLVAIDVLSKQVFATPTKSKKNDDMKQAFDNLLEQMPILPHKIFSDKGTEFLIKINMKDDKGEKKKLDYFEAYDILKYKSSTKTIKASLAERCIRNIKQRLYRYFSEHKTLNWIDVLEDVIKSINHSYSRAIKMRPKDVTFKNSQEVFKSTYGDEYRFKPNKKPKYKQDDSVRMANYKEVFDKGYLPNWSDEILTISQVKPGNPDVYKVKDERGEPFQGRYYAEDLGKIKKDSDTTYRIKILKKRIKNNIPQSYVKFIGYRDKPQWIPDSDLV